MAMVPGLPQFGVRLVPARPLAACGWSEQRLAPAQRITRAAWAGPCPTAARTRGISLRVRWSPSLWVNGGHPETLRKGDENRGKRQTRSGSSNRRHQGGHLEERGRRASTRHNVTFQCIYKDGDDWKTTQSFGRDDLLVLAKVADLAHTRASTSCD